VVRGCLYTGTRGFSYGEPWALWRALLPENRERVNALARRADTLSLGDYRLDEFNTFSAALIAMCAAHDFLCFRAKLTCVADGGARCRRASGGAEAPPLHQHN
jgi:hypothetical protein